MHVLPLQSYVSTGQRTFTRRCLPVRRKLGSVLEGKPDLQRTVALMMGGTYDAEFAKCRPKTQL